MIKYLPNSNDQQVFEDEIKSLNISASKQGNMHSNLLDIGLRVFDSFVKKRQSILEGLTNDSFKVWSQNTAMLANQFVKICCVYR